MLGVGRGLDEAIGGARSAHPCERAWICRVAGRSASPVCCGCAGHAGQTGAKPGRLLGPGLALFWVTVGGGAIQARTGIQPW